MFLTTRWHQTTLKEPLTELFFSFFISEDDTNDMKIHLNNSIYFFRFCKIIISQYSHAAENGKTKFIYVFIYFSPFADQRPCHQYLPGSRQAALHSGGVGQKDPSLL